MFRVSVARLWLRMLGLAIFGLGFCAHGAPLVAQVLWMFGLLGFSLWHQSLGSHLTGSGSFRHGLGLIFAELPSCRVHDFTLWGHMIRSLLATLRLLLLGLLAVASKPHMLGKCVVGLWSSLFGAFAFGAGPRDHRQLLASTHTRAFGSGHAHLWNQLFGAFVADPGPYTP